MKKRNITKTKKKPARKKSARGRKPDRRPRDSFEAWLLSVYGQKIARFLHRDRAELLAVHYAVVFRGYPDWTAEDEREIRGLTSKGVPAKKIAALLAILPSNHSGRAWARLLVRKTRNGGDPIFFELLAMMLAHPRPAKANVKGAALCYITLAEAAGFTPSLHGFKKWLRDRAGMDVVPERRSYGQDVVAPTEAQRAYEFVTDYRSP